MPRHQIQLKFPEVVSNDGLYPTLTLRQVLSLSTFHILTHLILTTTQLDRYYRYHHITDEETEVQR